MSRKRLIAKIAGGVFGVILICILIMQTDVSSLTSQLYMIRWYFLAVIGVTFVSQSAAVYAWYLSFFTHLKKSSFVHLFNIRLIGESFAQINPTNVIAGEALKGVLLKDKLGVNYLTGATSILLSRIMIVIAGAVLLIFGVAIMFQRLAFGNLQIISAIICGIIVVLLFFFIFALHTRRGFLRVIARIIQAIFGRFAWTKNAVSGLLQVDNELIEFYHKKRGAFYAVFFLSVMNRVIGSMEYFVIFYALGMDVDVFSCLLFDLSSMIFRSAGFFIPGQIGLEEAGNKIMFSLINIPGNETWITASLVRRGRQIFWILAGFVVYLFLSADIKKSSNEGVDNVSA